MTVLAPGPGVGARDAATQVRGEQRCARGLQVGDYAADARRIMAENPCNGGWRRRQLQACHGHHPRTAGAGCMVLWQRHRDYFHPQTFTLYDVAEDPALWVVEQISTCLCVSREWVWRVRTIAEDLPRVAEDLGLPWRLDHGGLRQGFAVRLEAANGRWLWRLTGEPAPCCGGYLARWPD
ncbi:hypothetical protein [Mycobacterium sp.]|uniref:hypothetical protein n=1 Tax=Mycobacterium sp. TaxID=1785 RepID=UPI0025F8BEA0|nr:hypothetical protein [Mycobacterium sp.]